MVIKIGCGGRAYMLSKFNINIFIKFQNKTTKFLHNMQNGNYKFNKPEGFMLKCPERNKVCG